MTTSNDASKTYTKWISHYNDLEQWYQTLSGEIPPPPPPVRHAPRDATPIPYTFRQWCAALLRWKDHVVTYYPELHPEGEEQQIQQQLQETTTIQTNDVAEEYYGYPPNNNSFPQQPQSGVQQSPPERVFVVKHVRCHDPYLYSVVDPEETTTTTTTSVSMPTTAAKTNPWNRKG